MTELEKRLIALSAHGIYITHMDGHRHIWSEPVEYFDYDLELNKHAISVNNKIYGGVKQALDVVDESLVMMGKPTLLEWFNDVIDEEWGVHLNEKPHDRIDTVYGNKGGLN